MDKKNQLVFDKIRTGFLEEATENDNGNTTDEAADANKNTNGDSPQLTFADFGIEEKIPSAKKEKTFITRELLETVIQKMKDDGIIDEKSKRNSLTFSDEGSLEIDKMLRIFENGNNGDLKSTIIKFVDDGFFFFFPDGAYNGKGLKINIDKIPHYSGPKTRMLEVKIFILSLLNKQLKQTQ